MKNTYELSKEDIPHLVTIMSGLLASGHYTNQGTKMPFRPHAVTHDEGPHWNKEGRPTRFMPRAIKDAKSLLWLLKRDLEWEEFTAAENEKETQ